MALRGGKALQGLARRVMAPHNALPVKGGGGGPVAAGRPPTAPLPEEDELLWDDGSAYPEYCLDRFEQVSKYEAFGMLSAGLGIFGALIYLAKLRSQSVVKPYTDREWPFDNLKVELGRE